ncbi:MAG: response regulator [Streptosporangiaceae bacterium]
MPVRLAVVDGQPLLRYGLREFIASHADIEIVAECQSAAGTPAMLAAAQPDVVTVDVALPDGDGLWLARELRAADAGLGIVMLTSTHDDDVLFRALESGVSAFVPKTAPLDELLAAIRHAAVAATCFTASGLAMAFARLGSDQGRCTLSQRETQVLSLLHEGLSIPAIAREIYISVSTTKTYVARLYDKLGAASRAQALMTALHLGLISSWEEAPPKMTPPPHRPPWPGAEVELATRRPAGLAAPWRSPAMPA